MYWSALSLQSHHYILIMTCLLAYKVTPSEGGTCLKCTYSDADPEMNVQCLDPKSNSSDGNSTLATCDGSTCYTSVNLPTASNPAVTIDRGCLENNETLTDCAPLKSSKFAMKHGKKYQCSCNSGDNCNEAHIPFERRKCYTCTYVDDENTTTISPQEPCLRDIKGTEVYCPDDLRRGTSLCVKVSGIKVGDGYIRVMQRDCLPFKKSLGCHNMEEYQAKSKKNPAILLRNALVCYCAADNCNGSPEWQPPKPKGNGGNTRFKLSLALLAFLLYNAFKLKWFLT